MENQIKIEPITVT